MITTEFLGKHDHVMWLSGAARATGMAEMDLNSCAGMCRIQRQSKDKVF